MVGIAIVVFLLGRYTHTDIFALAKRASDGISGRVDHTRHDTVAPRRVGTARGELERLGVAPPENAGGYRAAAFGAWHRARPGGCDLRDVVLARDSRDVARRGGCAVTRGRLHDPYSGRTVTFTGGHTGKLRLDHVIPLRLAWESGADRWSDVQRARFAADPANTRAVLAGHRGVPAHPAERPAGRSAQCSYAVEFVRVASHYRLTVTPADHDALTDMLDACE